MRCLHLPIPSRGLVGRMSRSRQGLAPIAAAVFDAGAGRDTVAERDVQPKAHHHVRRVALYRQQSQVQRAAMHDLARIRNANAAVGTRAKAVRIGVKHAGRAEGAALPERHANRKLVQADQRSWQGDVRADRFSRGAGDVGKIAFRAHHPTRHMHCAKGQTGLRIGQSAFSDVGTAVCDVKVDGAKGAHAKGGADPAHLQIRAAFDMGRQGDGIGQAKPQGGRADQVCAIAVGFGADAQTRTPQRHGIVDQTFAHQVR